MIVSVNFREAVNQALIDTQTNDQASDNNAPTIAETSEGNLDEQDSAHERLDVEQAIHDTAAVWAAAREHTAPVGPTDLTTSPAAASINEAAPAVTRASEEATMPFTRQPAG